MRPVWLTQSQFQDIHKTFREVQKEKPRFDYIWYTDIDWEYREKSIALPMTDSREELQKEYDKRNNNRIRKDRIYFILY